MDIPATLIASAIAIGGAIGTAVTLWAHRRQFLLEYRTETALKRLLNGSSGDFELLKLSSITFLDLKKMS